MRIFIPMLQNKSDVAHFFGFSVEGGWFEYLDSSVFDKIYVSDELAFHEMVKAKYSESKDLVIEEQDLALEYREIMCVQNAIQFINKIYERVSNGGNC